MLREALCEVKSGLEVEFTQHRDPCEEVGNFGYTHSGYIVACRKSRESPLCYNRGAQNNRMQTRFRHESQDITFKQGEELQVPPLRRFGSYST